MPFGDELEDLLTYLLFGMERFPRGMTFGSV
jgi:hypothetical protein